MKYCQTCGKQLVDDAVFCPGCGCAVGNNAPAGYSQDHRQSRWLAQPCKGMVLAGLKAL